MGLGDQLATAAWNGDVAAVQHLLERSAPVDGGFSNGHHSPLNGAARNGHAEIVALLLERGPDIESRCQAPWEVTPLQQAAYHGRAECARLLLRHGASTTSTSGPGCGNKDAKGIALQMRNGQWRELVEAIDAHTSSSHWVESRGRGGGVGKGGEGEGTHSRIRTLICLVRTKRTA